MINNVSAVGRKMVTIVDPHIKKDNNYKVYSQGKSHGYFIQDKDGNEYEGWCWPGACHVIVCCLVMQVSRDVILIHRIVWLARLH